jgi:hypothetical protein
MPQTRSREVLVVDDNADRRSFFRCANAHLLKPAELDLIEATLNTIFPKG